MLSYNRFWPSCWPCLLTIQVSMMKMMHFAPVRCWYSCNRQENGVTSWLTGKITCWTMVLHDWLALYCRLSLIVSWLACRVKWGFSSWSQWISFRAFWAVNIVLVKGWGGGKWKSGRRRVLPYCRIIVCSFLHFIGGSGRRKGNWGQEIEGSYHL